MAKSEADGLLAMVSKEPAELSETVYSTGTEAEKLSARPGSYVNVEVIEAIIAAEPNPRKLHTRGGVIDANLGAILHG